MAVASGIIFMWPSTNASIPAGWTRETLLDSCYIRNAANPGDGDLTTLLGQATHTHTSPAHTPIQNSHNHSVSSGAAVGFTATATAGGINVAHFSHTHTAVNSTSTTAVNNSVSITVDPTVNEIPYIEVIFIKSNGSPTGVPNGGLGYHLTDTFPSGWSRVFSGVYARGAAPGGDGGATGGSVNHTHTSPAHTHTQQSHTHSSFNSNTPDTTAVAAVGATQAGSPTHTHSLSLDAATAVNQSVTTTLTTVSLRPPSATINCIQNGTGGQDLPIGVVGLWGSTSASIPANWLRITGLGQNVTDRFPLNATNNGQSGNTISGSVSHPHGASDCQPIQNAHTHTVTAGAGATVVILGTGGTNRFANGNHTHVWTAANATATNQNTSVDVDPNTNESAYPFYKRVILIEFQGAPAVTTPPALMGLLGCGL